MSEFTTVARLSDLPPGEALCVEFGGEKIAVFNVDGRLYAISDACTHAGGPLSMGHVSGTEVTCPLHAWTFDLTTGNPTIPMGSAVKCYPVRAEGDEIQLAAPQKSA